MPTAFKPKYRVTSLIKKNLGRIDAAKEQLLQVDLSDEAWKLLRETTRLHTTHYSTMIEGNRLTAEQVEQVIKQGHEIGGRERDSKEVSGYYKAAQQVELWAQEKKVFSESLLQELHALVMSDGHQKVKPTPYRQIQNVIADGISREVVYMPPEPKDVPALMKNYVDWVVEEQQKAATAWPLFASVVHYQFVTIHPYLDGNGRTARLLTAFVLQEGGYWLKGSYSLEQYYALHLGDYYQALAIGQTHNYYDGRAEADITPWVEFFCEGMAVACENAVKRAQKAKNVM